MSIHSADLYLQYIKDATAPATAHDKLLVRATRIRIQWMSELFLVEKLLAVMLARCA